MKGRAPIKTQKLELWLALDLIYKERENVPLVTSRFKCPRFISFY